MSDSERRALLAGTVFDGSRLHHDCAVVIEGAHIAALLPRSDVPAAVPIEAMPEGAWLAPGFIDIQVNGGGDVLFNDDPTADGIAAIARAHRRYGTTALLPTLISDTPAKMRAALGAVQHLAANNPSVLGIHLEGPFLSPGKPGIHNPAMFRVPGAEDADQLTARRGGVTLVTLAPERVPAGFIARLVKAGVRVALGHSMATYAQTKAAMAEGLTGLTHIFNAMRQPEGREPGPVVAALETPGTWFGMIVDGQHVDPAMLRLALRGAARPMLVTDAMPTVGGTRSTFTLYDQEIRLRDGRCSSVDGRLAGAHLDMASAVRNCVELLDVSLTEALRFASAEPASFLGLAGSLGRIARGYRADLVAFDPGRLQIYGTWVAGRPAATHLQ
jgi:N-acetylglucosamine-6-phosphate deacetylase